MSSILTMRRAAGQWRNKVLLKKIQYKLHCSSHKGNENKWIYWLPVTISKKQANYCLHTFHYPTLGITVNTSFAPKKKSPQLSIDNQGLNFLFRTQSRYNNTTFRIYSYGKNSSKNQRKSQIVTTCWQI